MRPELCLGTAQFGMTYGITNGVGQVPEFVVSEILAQAKGSGIHWLDTAQAYGNAEAVLGRNLPAFHGFGLISKMPAHPRSEFSEKDVDVWENALLATCKRLRVSSLHALLMHAPADLAKPGAHHLEHWLLGLRERGLVKRIGVSIYVAKDLDKVNPALLDLVQLPLSLFDQQLILDGTVALLQARGTKIFARSLYLQGLLLTPSSHWPHWVSSEVRNHQLKLELLAQEKGCRLIDLALGFAKQQTNLDAVVIGLCSINELIELRESWSATSPWQKGECRNWALSDPAILDPRNW